MKSAKSAVAALMVSGLALAAMPSQAALVTYEFVGSVNSGPLYQVPVHATFTIETTAADIYPPAATSPSAYLALQQFSFTTGGPNPYSGSWSAANPLDYQLISTYTDASFQFLAFHVDSSTVPGITVSGPTTLNYFDFYVYDNIPPVTSPTNTLADMLSSYFPSYYSQPGNVYRLSASDAVNGPVFYADGVVPLPSTLLLVGAGLLGAGSLVRRRKA